MNDGIKIVSVKAWFKSDYKTDTYYTKECNISNIDPLCFEVSEGDDFYEVKIIRIKRREHVEIKKNKIHRFICEVQLHGYKKECELLYIVNEPEWMLYKLNGKKVCPEELDPLNR